MKTSELTGAALDWAVAIAAGVPADEIYISGRGKYQSLFRRNRDDDGNLDGTYTTGPDLLFSKKWEAGGPIIEREKIRFDDLPDNGIRAFIRRPIGKSDMLLMDCWDEGITTLIAAMPCYVASKLGDELDVPKELA